MAVLGLLHFHVNISVICFHTHQHTNPHCVFDWHSIEFIDWFGEKWHLYDTASSMYARRLFFHLLGFFIFFWAFFSAFLCSGFAYLSLDLIQGVWCFSAVFCCQCAKWYWFEIALFLKLKLFVSFIELSTDLQYCVE